MTLTMTAARITALHATTARLLAAYKANPTSQTRMAWLRSTEWQDATPAATMLTHGVYQG